MSEEDQIHPIFRVTNEFCSEHSIVKAEMERLKNEKKFWQKFFRSKWVYGIAAGIAVLFISWAVWVSDGVYAQKADTKQLTTILKDVKEMKEEIKCSEERRDTQRENDKKEIKSDLEKNRMEIKADNEKRDERERRFQERIIKTLMQIQKEMKR